MTETTIIQLAFNQRGKGVWRSRDSFGASSDVIDIPKEGEITKENRSRIDSLVARLDFPPEHDPDDEYIADKPCFARLVRIDNRHVELRLDPPDLAYAYRKWTNGKAEIVGDAGLWLETFVLDPFL